MSGASWHGPSSRAPRACEGVSTHGPYEIVATVTDDDGGVGSVSRELTVANVAPTPTIDMAGASSYNGIDFLTVEKGAPFSLAGRITDPGSDDLEYAVDFGDGNGATGSSAVNPPLDDGPLSPTVQPRDEAVAAANVYALTCLLTTRLTATDDDGGAGADEALVLVTGDADRPEVADEWEDLLEDRAEGEGPDLDDDDDDDEEDNDDRLDAIDAASMQCYLDTVAALSTVFGEVRDASTFWRAHRIVEPDDDDDDGGGLTYRDYVDQQLLTAWLNFANGAFDMETLVFDVDRDGVKDVPLGDVLTWAEDIRNDPGASRQQLRAAIYVLWRVNAAR